MTTPKPKKGSASRRMWAMNPKLAAKIIQPGQTSVKFSLLGYPHHPDYDEPVLVLDLSDPEGLVDLVGMAILRCPAIHKDEVDREERLARAALRALGLKIKP